MELDKPAWYVDAGLGDYHLNKIESCISKRLHTQDLFAEALRAVNLL